MQQANVNLFVYFIGPVYTFLSGQARSNAPNTPRIVLLGPTGSGKGVQASLLANKYNIVNGEISLFLFKTCFFLCLIL